MPVTAGAFGTAGAAPSPPLVPTSVLSAFQSSCSAQLPFSWAILGNARREPWEIWHSWQRGICKLQILDA